jgi:HTH-type transcriptional regulator/antitoxin HigA
MAGGGGKVIVTKRKKFNPRIYGELLREVLPRPIQTEAENERALAIVDRLMSKGEYNLSPEETTKEKAYPVPDAPGYQVLQTLMENRGVKQDDLLPIFGSRGIASEVYKGKRAVSKSQAKKLGDFFGISPAVFI